jgi:hypothetical protein
MDPSDKQAAKYRSKNLMGYIQDKVDVGMTKLRSDEGVALDVAVLKATLQDEVVPKEKHVRTLKIACAGSAPRQQVGGLWVADDLKQLHTWIQPLSHSAIQEGCMFSWRHQLVSLCGQFNRRHV